MCTPAKIKKLDEVVVNRIAAGEVIQRPANALKELMENSLDAKATNIQITTKEGGLKLLQIQDNGTGIRKDDMDIVCERFTTSKLQNFEDLNELTTFGFRGEALASISHVALLTITTKTASEKCAYKATYLNSKLKAPPTACAGNQGTVITIENLFYNVATRRKALSSSSEEFTKITEVVMKYAIHNPIVGFTLKRHGETSSQVRTPHDSTKQNNIKILYGNAVARELLEIELNDEAYKFKMHGLITNPSYKNKRMIMLLFINNRLVDSSSIRKMLEEVYSTYLPKKEHPWCYLSLDINPRNIDVNVHPTKHEVRFLHEDAIIEKIKIALDEKLDGNSASRTFYLQARLPKADITREVLEEVLPNHGKGNPDKSKKIYAKEMVRTDSSDQKLDKFNFTMHSTVTHDKDNTFIEKSTNELQPEILNSEAPLEKTAADSKCQEKPDDFNLNIGIAECDTSLHTKETVINELQPEILNSEAPLEKLAVDSKCQGKPDESNLNIAESDTSLHTKETVFDDSSICWSDIINDTTPSKSSQDTFNKIISIQNEKPVDINPKDNTSDASEYDLDKTTDDIEDKTIDIIADKARKQVYKYFGNKDLIDNKKKSSEKEEQLNILENIHSDKKEGESSEIIINQSPDVLPLQGSSTTDETKNSTTRFKSYSVNDFRHEVKLTSILKLRKEVEEECHEGLREILANLTFVGCIDQTSAIIQSGVNLYICNTTKLAEELFYEIMLYDFANFGIIKFSEHISLFDLAMIALDTGETGWTEEDGPKEELASRVKELLLEKADMMNEYFSIVIDKLGNLKSLPVLLDKYFPYEAEIPLYMMRLATEVDWRKEQYCFQNICRETAKFYSYINPKHQGHDWKYITEHVLYPAIKESLLPPKHFAHDSTLLQIASLPDLYKVFERC